MTSWAKSDGPSGRPRRRIVRSSRPPVSLPTGAARFWASSACTTWETLTPAASRAAGWSSTVISRSIPPTTLTCATPPIARSDRVTPGSAKRVSVAAGTVSDVSVSVTTGSSEGSNRVNTGSFISVGRSSRLVEMASRMSCEACWIGFSNSKKMVQEARPSVAEHVDFSPSTPLMLKMASSTGSMISRVTSDGDADDRLLNVRELVGVEVQESKDAKHHQRHHGGDCDDGTLNGKIGDEHQRLTSSWVTRTGVPSVIAWAEPNSTVSPWATPDW